jgi:class 3 adenylate cyclase
MRNLTDWLSDLGLGQYATLFAENDIGFIILADRTDQDLEKIGVASLGHRRKILRAIAELARAPAEIAAKPATRLVEPAPNSETSVAALQDSQAGTNGDRRYLNVMLSDLVGSTGISAQLDAEEWRDLIISYLDAASAAVTDIGGRVLKKLQTRPERKAA